MSIVKEKIPTFDRELREERSYWLKKLSREIGASSLRLDYDRPAVYLGVKETLPINLPDALTSRLRQITGDSSFLTYTALLAALTICLHKYTGSDSIVVGSPGRRRNGETDVKANALAIVTDIDGRMSVRKFLLNVRETLLEAYARQSYPFERLVKELDIESHENRCALFDILLALEDIHGEIPEVRTDINIKFYTSHDRIAGHLTYDNSLFRQDTIERFTSHFINILHAALQNVDASIDELQMLTDSERHQLLLEWNDTEADYPKGLCIHHLFESVAARTPDAVAVIFENEQLSYRELNRRANQLAHFLRAEGVGPEVMVAVLMERSLELIVAILGILKAGGAYVPLDPTHPAERREFVLGDTRAPVLLTKERLEQSGEVCAARVVCLDDEWQAISRLSTENPSTRTVADNLAYVIYTSGSTGKPKGVMIEHRGVCNLATAQARVFNVRLDSRVLQFASTTFDASVSEIFMALTTGATLCLGQRGEHFSGPALTDLLRRQAITNVTLPPAVLAVLPQEELPALETIIAAGERCPAEVAARFSEGRSFFNAYGPTETTVCASIYKCESDDGEEPPVGRPMSNMQIYLLDGAFQPVPPGVNGELYVGGVGIGRGYLNRPGLTAEKFVPDPFSREGGARLYKTGDLARYRPDGNIEFLGRSDHQVKLRGYRIELGEIEAALSTHADVLEAVVLAREDVPGNKRLVAYVVPKQEGTQTTDELRQHLSEKLPAYMLPSAFVLMNDLPLTHNGKIDRRALPSPEQSQQGRATTGLVSRTPVEEVLAGIWAEVLGIENIGITDNFFELGGHSLMATQLVSRVREAFGVEVALQRLFEQPTIAAFAESVEAELRAGQRWQAPPLEPVSREENLPLSFAQQRLWFLDQLAPNNTSYNISAAVRLKGQLDTSALSQALSEITRRHEVLRTTFAAADGRPVQVISPAEPLNLSISDLTLLADDERTAKARRYCLGEAQRPFDLSTGPLLRASLLRLAQQEHILVVTMHHIVSDGWSIGILVHELASLYTAFSTGEASPLPELEIQYADYAHWQREWLQGEVLDEQLSYWREQLADAPPLLELPTDRPRPPIQTYNGANHFLLINADLTRSLKALSQRHSVTLFMTLLAALQTLLYRYSGQQDISVSTGIAGRTRPEIEPLIGFFVNTLVLRSRLHPRLRFKELLAQVREVTLGAYAHQDVPFELLVEELEPERNPSYTPLFQVMLVLQNAPLEQITLPGLQISQIGGEHTSAKFDLTLFVEERQEQMEVRLEYNTDLFDSSTARQMLQAYGEVLAGAVEDEEQEIEELRLMSEEEEQEVVEERASTGHQEEAVEHIPIHEWFREVATAHAAKTAIAAGERRVSYEELERESNRLANLLLSSGAVAGSIVAIMTEDGVEMITAMLATLKAGAAFMPLDVHLPVRRLSLMVSVTAPRYCIADAHLTPLVEALAADAHSSTPMRLITTDSEAVDVGLSTALTPSVEWLGDYHSHSQSIPPAIHYDPDALAYIYFTSGSTGTPKAIAGRLKAIDHFIQWEIDALGLESGVRVSQLLAPTFDGSLRDFFVPLCLGGTVCLPQSRDLLLDVRRLVEWIDTEQITLMHCVPSLLRAIINEGLREEQFTALRHVVLAGEALLPSDVARWYEVFGERVQIVNLYGTSETTMAKLCYFVRAGDERRASIPIGEAISRASVLLLDEMGRVCRVGAVGEIHIQSEYRSLGYYNQPELTAEAFVPHPFPSIGGEVIYRTGDMGRELEDGVLEYLGRRDQQVKVRGQRVELAEVESVLRAQAGVQDVAVIAREDGSGYTFLCAYLVLAADAEEGDGTEQGAEQGAVMERVRAGMAQELADYMLPSAYVVIEEMPRTISGKVDRRALPEPSEQQAEVGTQYEAPRTAIEEMVAQSWAGLLGRERVGRDENFFRIGGHSLLATQVLSRVREVFGVEVALRRLFGEPTVAGLARSIEEGLSGERTESGPPLVSVSRAEELVLSYGQQRLWFLEQLEPGSTAYNMAAAVRLTGELNVRALEQALTEIIARHEVIRTTFRMSNGRPVQVIAEAEPMRLDVLDLSHLDEDERESEARRIAAEESERPFDLSVGPLLRVGLLCLDADEHVLMVTTHHIASDGWSLGVFVGEVARLYNAYLNGQPSPLPELQIQYADYAHWQREWLKGEVLDEQLQYWREQLGGAPPLLELPLDHPRPAIQTYNGAHLSLTFDRQLTDSLKALSQRADVTLFMTLLAAFQTLLYRYTGQEDVPVGTPIAGRTRAEVEPLIGFFVNTLVLRSRLSSELRFDQLLRQLREITLGAYAHQELPFELLVEALQPQRNLSHSPLFQVMLSLQNAPLETLQLGNLKLSSLRVENSTAKFDLNLALAETDGELHGMLEYNTSLFEAATITQLAGHFERLLAEIVADPGQRISELPLLSEAEREQIIYEWNDTARHYPRHHILHHLFESQVAATPLAAALCFQEQQLSFHQLNERANSLAHLLLSRGVTADSTVAILCERSIELVVALFATLKAGAAYLPLDPSHPPLRLAMMTDEASPSVILTQEALLTRLPQPLQTQPQSQSTPSVICLDSQWPLVAAHLTANPTVTVWPENLAYVIYTSGSTGTPKAAMNTHQAICNRLLWMQEAYPLDQSDAILQKTTISFDVSVWEFFWPLIVGARLVLAEPGGHRDSAYLVKVIAEERITTLHFVPSMLKVFLEEEGLEQLTTLRRVMSSGEALQRVDVRRFHERLPQCELHNLYGPTEAAVDVTARECLASESEEVVPIGRPIANTQIYIVNDEMEVVPVGVEGEIYIGGIGLARGYMNQAERTAERFVPDPFSRGQRLYRTGDVGRYGRGREIEYLRRLDEQVKVRGQRVELGEVEAVLGGHDEVRAAAVVMREAEGGGGGKQLVGYVQWRAEEREEELRKYLRERLPEYMVPGVIVGVEEMPLTASGKIDRRALPKVSRERSATMDHSFVAPRSEIERMIAGVWREVLRVERVGVNDNFFDLGGHSLLVIEVRNKLQETDGQRLSVIELFQYPTIDALAKYLSQKQSATLSLQKINQRAEKQKEALHRQRQLAKQRARVNG